MVQEPGDPPSTTLRSLLNFTLSSVQNPKNVWGRFLLKGTCWKQIACLNRSCRNTRTSAKWLCDCGRPWYICNIHAPLGHLSGTAPRSNPEHVTKENRKRGLINTDHVPLPDELLRKRRHAEGHEDNRMRDRKRKASLPSSAQNYKYARKGIMMMQLHPSIELEHHVHKPPVPGRDRTSVCLMPLFGLQYQPPPGLGAVNPALHSFVVVCSCTVSAASSPSDWAE